MLLLFHYFEAMFKLPESEVYLHQEFFIIDTITHLEPDFPKMIWPAPQGPYYCFVSFKCI